MERLSRRRFLEDSLLGLAALSVPGAARADKPEKGRKIGPNDRIRVAVIGIGMGVSQGGGGRGMAHVNDYLEMDDVDLVYVCDADTRAFEYAFKAAQKAGKKEPIAVQDMRRIFDDKNVDAVSIATQNHWHALSAIWAMQAGKDVYVEKPVSHNVWEGRQIVNAARKYNKVCQTGTQSRASKGLQEAMAYLHSGQLGKIHLSRGLCYKPRNSIGKVSGEQAPPSTVDYNLWSGPAPLLPVKRYKFHYDWHWLWAYGSGDLGNQGIHEMDKARWGLNKKEMPRSVLSLGGRFGYEDDGETANTQLSFFDYDDSQLIFEVRGLPTPDLRGAKVGNLFYGEKGVMVMPSYSSAAAFDNDGNKIRDFSGGGNHFRNFIDTMRSRKVSDLYADIEDGHLSSALCHLGNISYRLGELVPFSSKSKTFGDNKEAYETFGRYEEHLAANGIDLKTAQYRLGRDLDLNVKQETFKGDREANRMLTRDYREPFVVPKKV